MARDSEGRSRRVTLVEIARAANVSKSTVSLVLNDSENIIPISEATRAKVLETAAELGYRPNAAARALATGLSNTVLMVSFDLWDENLIERLRGVESHLLPHGYSIRMSTIGDEQGLSAFSHIIHSGQADGVLLTGMAAPETYGLLRQMRTEAASVGIPMVALADAFPGDLVDHVALIDDRSGAFEAVSHLISHGHRRIIFLGVKDQEWSTSREEGYRSALEASGLPVDESLVVRGSSGQRFAYDTTLEMARSAEFSAIFAVTDNAAIAAMSALKAAGKRVPYDCALIGFDNNAKVAPYTDPPLTTVENPFYETGKRAAEMLLALVGGRPVEQAPLAVSLVIRRSCGC